MKVFRMISLFSFVASPRITASFSAGSTTRKLAFRILATTSHKMSSESAEPHPPEKMPYYALGVNLGIQTGQSVLRSLAQGENMEVVLDGFADVLRQKIDPSRAQDVLIKYGEQANRIVEDTTAEMMLKWHNEGEKYREKFLKENKDAIQTESGLIYKSKMEGSGKSPEITDTVEVHYHGTLTTGEVFDSSVMRQETIRLPLLNVIKGWQEGIPMMKEGGKATLVIPSDLAYGSQGSGDAIPPGATLTFDIELFKIVE
mmetsp:Transcript_12681/g.29451  ORF Transcript_12681/g.29451 Transcript_12681/m.29451 type:complete len:258 (-) Transcript_12681:39-812(-)